MPLTGWNILKSGASSPEEQSPTKGSPKASTPAGENAAPVTGATKKLMKGLEANGINRDSPVVTPKKVQKEKVYVNVYNLMPPESNKKFGMLGVGIFHSGVVVFGEEWSFGGSRDIVSDASGVFAIPPKAALPSSRFHSSVYVGETSLSQEQVRWILRGMGREWTMSSYHILSRNCNHFSEDLCRKLGCSYPSWINRAAKLSNALVPRSVLEYVLGTVPQPPQADAPGASPAGSPPSGFTRNGGPVPAPSGCQCNNPRCPARRGARSPPGATQDAAAPVPQPIPDNLSDLSVRQLKTIMFVHKVSWAGCVEKDDLVAKLAKAREEERRAA